MYVLSGRIVSALIRVLFCCLFPLLLRNSGNKYQNKPLVSAETVRRSSTCIIPYEFNIFAERRVTVNMTNFTESSRLLHCNAINEIWQVLCITAKSNPCRHIDAIHVATFVDGNW